MLEEHEEEILTEMLEKDKNSTMEAETEIIIENTPENEAPRRDPAEIEMVNTASNSLVQQEGLKDEDFTLVMRKKKKNGDKKTKVTLSDNRTKIKTPETSEQDNPLATLQYIRDFYENLYKPEASLTKQQNQALVKVITQEETSTIITQLPNNKAPDTDRLTYEFYKSMEEEVTPVLEKVFN
ncbi:11110_t:CDS:2 [Racocetra fulgida]|uniref:11110_t:CDS:1 n=1 Tax=Racocetra fulgida TaxID=60492 RepID=A0A9N8ZFW2_9GLOM|nr:11110_t:CDS:2 [Racocetra fulgida]